MERDLTGVVEQVIVEAFHHIREAEQTARTWGTEGRWRTERKFVPRLAISSQESGVIEQHQIGPTAGWIVPAYPTPLGFQVFERSVTAGSEIL